MTWRELSNALSFGGHTTSRKKQKVVKLTKEEHDASVRGMSIPEMKELMRSMSEAEKGHIHTLRKALLNTPSEHGKKVGHDGSTLLNSRQAWCEALIVFFGYEERKQYELTCCGYGYEEGADLHRGMKVLSCPSCGTNNPEGREC